MRGAINPYMPASAFNPRIKSSIGRQSAVPFLPYQSPSTQPSLITCRNRRSAKSSSLLPAVGCPSVCNVDVLRPSCVTFEVVTANTSSWRSALGLILNSASASSAEVVCCAAKCFRHCSVPTKVYDSRINIFLSRIFWGAITGRFPGGGGGRRWAGPWRLSTWHWGEGCTLATVEKGLGTFFG